MKIKNDKIIFDSLTEAIDFKNNVNNFFMNQETALGFSITYPPLAIEDGYCYEVNSFITEFLENQND